MCHISRENLNNEIIHNRRRLRKQTESWQTAAGSDSHGWQMTFNVAPHKIGPL